MNKATPEGKTPEGAKLVITIDVPEGVSDEEMLKAIQSLIEKADALHRGYGGNGLRLDDGGVVITRPERK